MKRREFLKSIIPITVGTAAAATVALGGLEAELLRPKVYDVIDRMSATIGIRRRGENETDASLRKRLKETIELQILGGK